MNEQIRSVSGSFRTAASRAASFIFHSSFFILLAIGAVSCGGPRVIPDNKLAQIFHDAYLINSYSQTKPMNFDSLNVYEPVFEKYGYTTEDVQYTIGNFAKRKSARLSDVVDMSIGMLEAESRFYQGRVAVHDTIGRIARDRFAETVYSDTLIAVRKPADTARLRITVPIEKPGTYEVSYRYLVDSADRNTNLRVNHYLLDARGRQSFNNSRRLKHGEKEKVSVTFDAGETHRKLVLDLNGYPKDLKKPSMTVDTLVVKYYLPDGEARIALARSLFDFSALDSLAYPERFASDTVRYVLLPDERTVPENFGALPADS